MNITFTVDPSDLISRVADAGEIDALIRALISEGYTDDFVGESDPNDLLSEIDDGTIAEYVKDNMSLSDVFDADDVLNEVPRRDLISYVYDNLSLDDVWGDEEALAAIDNDSIRDYVQQNNLLPTAEPLSDDDLLAEVQRRVADCGLDAKRVMAVLTQTGKVDVETVYYVK